MDRLPDREAGHPSPRDLLARLAAHVGEARAAQLCAELLAAAEPGDHAETVLYLGGDAGRSVLEGTRGWKPYWSRVWGARGLLYVWDDSAADAVLDGLDDPAWRVAEMCLKVAASRGLPAGDGAVRLADHELPRVRAAAVRALGAAGDVEHVAAVHAATDDEAEEVRRAAVRALEQMSARLDLPPEH
jgi:hypothetical protein